MNERRWQQLQLAIEDLYETFSGYRVTSFKDLGCYDFGPSESEYRALEGSPLREVPKETLRSMEFYDPSWDT